MCRFEHEYFNERVYIYIRRAVHIVAPFLLSVTSMTLALDFFKREEDYYVYHFYL